MDLPTIIMIGLALILMLGAYLRGDGALGEGLKAGGQTFLNIAPLLIAVFVIVGLSQVLIPQKLIAEMLGRDSGLKGILIASGMGAITPGGPFVIYPLVATLSKSGAAIGPVVAYVTGWSLWAVTRIPLELSIVGPHLTFVRITSTLIFPPLAGLIATLLFQRAS